MDRASAPRERGPAYLTVLVKNKEVQRRPITGPVTLGRSLDCDIWIDDPRLSRRHCRVELALQADGWAVVDLGSRNGTCVNGKPVSGAVGLHHQDLITIGDAEIEFHAHGYIPPRPSDPGAALLSPSHLRQAIDERAPTPHQQSDRPLPTPQVRHADSTIVPSPGETLAGNAPAQPAPAPHHVSKHPHKHAHKPLPFTRPPARPIVKPMEEQ